MGRKYRSISEELKKENEELHTAKQKLEQQLEEAQTASGERSGASEQAASELKEQCDRLTQVGDRTVCVFVSQNQYVGDSNNVSARLQSHVWDQKWHTCILVKLI